MELLEILRCHLVRYPLMRPQDLVKLVFQNEFGGGHLVSSVSETVERIRQEAASRENACQAGEIPTEACEDIGGGLCRYHLCYLKESGLSPETLGRLFSLSAREIKGSRDSYLDKLALVKMACRDGRLSVDGSAFARWLDQYLAQGITHPGHSDIYRQYYKPAYRIISASYCRLSGVFSAIDRCLEQKGSIRIAIDGNSGAGKSVLASLLQKIYEGNLFHMDDFFLQARQRTAARYAETGGNIDYERFRDEVLAGLDSGRGFSYRRFDCREMALKDTISVEPRAVNIVEGVYSLHPMIDSGYDLKLFLTLTESGQQERILRRNGPVMLERFIQEWIPLENKYFAELSIREKCDMVINGEMLL